MFLSAHECSALLPRLAPGHCFAAPARGERAFRRQHPGERQMGRVVGIQFELAEVAPLVIGEAHGLPPSTSGCWE